MLIILLITFVFIIAFYVVFFRFRWLKFNAAWAIVCLYVFVHLLLTFVIGLRFVTPYTSDVTVIQHTIQLIPRLPEPTLVTAVLVKPDVPIKKGTPLFQFDRRPYEYKVGQLNAQIKALGQKLVTGKYRVQQYKAALAAADQDVLMLRADLEGAVAKVAKIQSELEYSKVQNQRYKDLSDRGAGPVEDYQKYTAQVRTQEAALSEAKAQEQVAKLRFEAQINGVNPKVAEKVAEIQEAEAQFAETQAQIAAVKAELELANYYLDNTTMVAPEDGRIINLQVRPGMVSGIVRAGGIAAFIVDEDRYVLARFFPENLKYVKTGQFAEVMLQLYPGQVFPAKVDSIWWANGEGQLLPTDFVPKFEPQNPDRPQNQFAVKLYLDKAQKAHFPMGTLGGAAIYTETTGAWAALRRIAIRIDTWLNWLYPLPI